MVEALRIALLGAFEVGQGDREAQFETDATRALLAYLALHPGKAFHREVLAGLLWPEHPRAEALHALRQTLNRLRHAIGDREASPALLHITRQAIGFNPSSSCWLDVSAFTELVAAAHEHRHRRFEVCRPCMQRLQQAADLYRGDLMSGFYLDSVPFEEWLLLEREKLHRQAMEVFHDLADFHERREEYEQAQRYARRQLELESWREEGHRQLMRVLALSGQRSAALAQYEAARRVLEEELGVEPAVETTRLYEQICAGEFKGSSPPTHNLPAHLTAFVGRGAELDHIAELLNDRDCRLLTLLGPGGVGKTRLALQAAAAEKGSFRDGVYAVPVAALRSADFLAPALAQALQLTLHGEEPPLAQVCSYLRNREILLVLDGFEHLLEAATIVNDLLRRAPGLNVLATSRERLNVPGEWLLNVEGLDYPRSQDLGPGGAGTSAEDCGAVRLFVSGARRVRPEFSLSPADLSAVVRVCQLVEGMPLAIELAAAWVQVLSCPEIPLEIQKDLDFLATTMQGIPQRHRSLRAVFDASWALLSPDEQQVLRRMAVLYGSFDRPAAEAVAGATAPLLVSLVNKSFLRQESLAGEVSLVRYEMHDLLRRYAAEKLAESPEEEGALDRHCDYYTALLAGKDTELRGGAQRHTLQIIGVEMADVRAAWEWACRRGKLAQVSQALESLFIFYNERSWFQEGQVMFGQAAACAMASGAQERAVLARALARQGWFTFRLGQRDSGRDLLERGLSLARESGTRRDTAFALNGLGAAALDVGSYDQARQHCLESLAICRETGDHYEQAIALNILGQAACSLGDYEEARSCFREGLTLARQAGLHNIAADGQRQLGNLAYVERRFPEAAEYYERALQGYRELGNRWGESAALGNLAGVYSRQGGYARAKTIYEQALSMKQEIGDRWGEANVLSNLGAIANEQGAFVQARDYFERALQIRRELGAREGEALTTHNVGVAFLYLGDYAEANSCLQRALQIRSELGHRQGQGRTLATLSLLQHLMGQDEVACESALRGIEIAQDLGDRSVEAEGQINLGHALVALGQLEQAGEAYRKAVALFHECGSHHMVMEALAGLARVDLARQDLPQACVWVEEILKWLEAHSLDGTEEPGRVFLTCYQVLWASEDPRAELLLEQGYRFLQERAHKIDDPAVRRGFWENVAAHREMQREWSARGPRKG